MADSSGTIGSGGDYTDVADWEDSIDTSTDPSIGSMLDGFEETSAVDANGASPTATNYAELTSDSGAEHDGRAHEVSAAGNARVNFAGANEAMRITDDYFHITWLEIKGPGANNFPSLQVVFIGTADIFIHHNIVHNNHASSGSQEGMFLNDTTALFKVYRNIVYGVGYAGIRIVGSGVSEVFNNTSYENNVSNNASRGGIMSGDADCTVKYNASYDNGNEDFRDDAGTFDWNTASDTSAVGSNSNNSETATDDLIDPTTTFTSTDLLIKAGSSLIDDSETVSTTGRPGIDESIDARGVSITGTWDKGASQLVAGGNTQMSGSASLVITTTGGADLESKLSGDADLVITSTGNAGIKSAVSGSSSLVITASGDISKTFSMSGSASLVITATGDIKKTFSMSGSSSLVIASTAGLSLTASASGSSSLVITASGNLDIVGSGAISGSSSLVITTTGNAGIKQSLSGSSSLVIATTGDLTVIAATQMSGSSSLVIASTGNLALTSAIAGGSTLAITATGDITTGSDISDADAEKIATFVWKKILDGNNEAQELMRLFTAVLGGLVSGMEDNLPAFRNLANTKTVITMETDNDGNRKAVISLDLD